MAAPPGRTALIVDAHPLWLDALQNLLEHLEISVVGRGTGRGDAIRLLEEQPVDILLADLAAISDETADHANACTALLRAREINPDMKCIVLSEGDDPADLDRAFNSGATAFCVKRAE